MLESPSLGFWTLPPVHCNYLSICFPHLTEHGVPCLILPSILRNMEFQDLPLVLGGITGGSLTQPLGVEKPSPPTSCPLGRKSADWQKLCIQNPAGAKPPVCFSLSTWKATTTHLHKVRSSAASGASPFFHL